MLRIPGKIPVYISPFFWLLAGAIGWLSTRQIEAALMMTFIIFASVLIHEYGHALTAVAFGQAARIELVGFGGVTHRRGGSKLPLWKEFLIVFNGPLAGFLLFCVMFWINKRFFKPDSQSLGAYLTWITYYVNAFWTVLNLLPVQPLDGGKLLSIVLESVFGLRGVKLSFFVSLLLSSVLGLFFFSRGEFLLGALFCIFAFESYRAWQESLAMTEQDKSYIIQHLFKEAEKDLKLGHREEALKKFLRVREAAGAGVLYQSATEHAAHLLALDGKEKEAWEILTPIKNPGPEAITLLQTVAFHLGKYQEAATLGSKAYRALPNYETAITSAMAHAMLHEVPQAIGWLQCAVKELGHPLGDVLQRKEFDPIRSDPHFRSIVEGNT